MRNLNSRLLWMLFALTLLCIFAQLSLFIVHYKVSSILDSLASSSIVAAFFSPLVWVPVLLFIGLQLVAYVLFIYGVWLLALMWGALGKLAPLQTYGMGVLFWIVGMIAILTLNIHYYPHSFFSGLLMQFVWISRYHNVVMKVATLILLSAAGGALAYALLISKRMRFAGGALLCASMVALFLTRGTEVPKPAVYEQPNIIIIGLDSLRPDFIGFSGNKKIRTPHIDQFLKNAMVFTNAYTPLARTFPSWISILTAKYPKHSHARFNLEGKEAIVANETLAKRLQSAGYFTIYGTDEPRFTDIDKAYGFNRIVGPRGGAVEFLLGSLSDFPLTNLLINLPQGRWLFPYNYANRAADLTYEPDNFLRLIERGIESRPDKPLFLAIHLCLSHWPFSWARDGQTENVMLPDRYKSSVEAVDQQLGAVFHLLDKAKLLEKSLVILLSDHGTTLGMINDRVITKENYRGPVKNLREMTAFKLSGSKDFSISTSYGQGTDVLSLKQYKMLLAFQGFGVEVPAGTRNILASTIDIAPTILEFLQQAPLPAVDGVSLRPYLTEGGGSLPQGIRPFYIETADTIADMEGDKIFVDKILQKVINAYAFDSQSGSLYVIPAAAATIVKNKERAVLVGNWMLASYPAQTRYKLMASGAKKTFKLKPFMVPPYYVLVNLKTGLWTVGWDTPFAQTAPVMTLMKAFLSLYGDELA